MKHLFGSSNAVKDLVIFVLIHLMDVVFLNIGLGFLFTAGELVDEVIDNLLALWSVGSKGSSSGGVNWLGKGSDVLSWLSESGSILGWLSEGGSGILSWLGKCGSSVNWFGKSSHVLSWLGESCGCVLCWFSEGSCILSWLRKSRNSLSRGLLALLMVFMMLLVFFLNY